MPHTLRNASRCHVSCRRKICIDAHIQIRVVHVLILNNLFLLPNITRWINSLQNISSSLWSHINPPWICKPFLFEGINNWPNLCHKFWGWWGDDNPSIGVSDTHVLLLNEYIVELNPAKFKILNQILNWIFLQIFELNIFLNCKFLNWIFFWIEFSCKFLNWIFFWIEFSWNFWIE